jgi:hypothetical protein
MKRLVRTISTSLYVMSLSGLASTAAAQDRPSFEASGGWNLLRSTEIDEMRIPVHREHSFRFNVNADSADAEQRFRPS